MCVQWFQVGGVCTRTLGTFIDTTQDNWAYSQYINYLDAREVIINITYNFNELNDFITIYRSDSNTILTDTQRLQQNRYQPINGTTTNSRLIQSISTRSVLPSAWGFTRPTNFNGFYLALQDQGVLVITIQRIFLYYRVAVARTDGLLSCPAVPLPPLGGTSMGTCSCAANSAPVSGVSLDTTCNYDGVCCGGQWCGCLPGYQLQNTNLCNGE